MFTRARQQLNGFPALATTTVVGYTISLLQKKCTLQTLTNQEVVFKSRVRPKAQRHKGTKAQSAWFNRVEWQFGTVHCCVA